MERKRVDLAELRQQRERVRRITVGAMVVAMVVILASCQGLTARDAAAPTQQARVHAKTALIGGVLSTVGSSHLDGRSITERWL